MSAENEVVQQAMDAGSLIRIDQETASNNILFLFEHQRNTYIVKELLLNSKYFRFVSKEPETLAMWMSKAFAIISKYFCDDDTSILNTRYFVAVGQYSRQSTVVTLQEEARGYKLSQQDRSRKEDPTDVLRRFEKKWEQARRDPEWQEFPDGIREFFQEMDITLDHIIYDRGKYNLVDW